MSYNYSKLRGRIVERCGTQSNFAKLIGMSNHTLSLKMNNKIAFTQRDIQKASNVLQIQASEIPVYFFNIEVQIIEPVQI